MKVAPFHACVGCYRGDTPTVVFAEGDAEWIIAVMSRIAGMTVKEAAATFAVMAQEVYGCDPGMVPAGRITPGIRLCRECATKNGVPAAALIALADAHEGDPVGGYIQPPDEDDR